MDAQEAVRYLRAGMTRYPSPRNEVEHAVEKIYETILENNGQYNAQFKAPKWPEQDPIQIREIAASNLGAVDLWERSPIRLGDDLEEQAQRVLPRLFPNNPWVCAGDKCKFFTERLDQFLQSAGGLEQVVPSPMTAKYGKTKDGKQSQHTLDATGPRRFLIVEGDKIEKDIQAAILLKLAEKMPLALVVDSGGKSLHGWFYVDGQNEDKVLSFFRRACVLGADRGLWTRSQFARMPGGMRSNGNRQNILYWNPEAIA